MEDVTTIMNGYRECVRHLWNTYFWQDAEPTQDWDLSDRFDEIAVSLFRSLVLRKLNREDVEVQPDCWSEHKPFHFLRLDVDPRSMIMINRGVDTGYWDDPVTGIEKGDLDLRFLQFFDWWLLGFREFELYRARIVESARYPHLVGRDALLPVSTSVKVLHLRTA